MIFLDANIPMYLVGAEHPNKHVAQRLLDDAIAGRERLVTDAEVFQEVLHRYGALRRPDAIQPAFDLITRVVDEVIAIDIGVVKRAKDILLGHPGLSSRDAVHIAAMHTAGVDTVMTFDAGFDHHPGIRRLS